MNKTEQKASTRALLRAVNSIRDLRDILNTLEVNDRVIFDSVESASISESFKAMQIALAVLKAEGVDTTEMT